MATQQYLDEFKKKLTHLNNFNIAFEIVPGVTSASAAVATMQTGLTMRAVAKSVTFSTGYFKDSEENEVDVNAFSKWWYVGDIYGS